MGLGDLGLFDDGDGGDGGKVAAAVSCSICLDAVMDNGDRSWAKLQCGHQFHLDCIGSAFNAKGAMQCPNCRKIEKGQWLYANGSRSLPEFSMDDWAHDDDLYDISYSEMSFGVHWCPFSTLNRLPSSFDEGEFQSNSYHDLLGHHAVFAEHNPVSSTTHPCPYIAYLGPVHPSSSSSSGNIPDGSSFNNHWSGPSEVTSSYGFPTVDVHYHNWDHSSHFSATNRDQLSIPSMTHRTARNNSDVPRHGIHPFIIGHSPGGRTLGSLTSPSVLPPYPGAVARPRERHPYPINGPMARTSSGRRSSSHRGLAQVASMASSSDQSSGFFFFSPTSSSTRAYQEAENNPIHHQPAFPLSQFDRDSIWGPFHAPTGFRPRQMPSRNQS